MVKFPGTDELWPLLGLGLGSGVWGLGSGVWGLGSGVWGLGSGSGLLESVRPCVPTQNPKPQRTGKVPTSTHGVGSVGPSAIRPHKALKKILSLFIPDSDRPQEAEEVSVNILTQHFKTILQSIDSSPEELPYIYYKKFGIVKAELYGKLTKMPGTNEAGERKQSVVLVTGGSGLVGKAIENIIREENNAEETWIFASSKDGDLRDKDQTKAMFEKYKPTHCIHVRIRPFLAIDSAVLA